ncbi:MAG: hypothetical protein EBT09_12450, partial [Actinobacteria bacterium]|nr:hypothetical protein [Actinomycetota bacterium]
QTGGTPGGIGTYTVDQSQAAASGTITSSSNGNVLTVSAITSGTLAVGQTLYVRGIPTGTMITGQTGGTTGGIGTYTVSSPASTVFTASQTTTNLTVTGTPTGPIVPGQTLSITGSPTIVSQTSGTTGGSGVYVVSVSQTVSSREMTTSIAPTASFHTSANTFNVTSASPDTLSIGQMFYGRGIPSGSTIASQVSGATGGIGTYTVSTVSSQIVITGYQLAANLTVTNVTGGAIIPGLTLSLPGSPTINSQTSGTTGSAGVYVVSVSQTIGTATSLATFAASIAPTTLVTKPDVLTVSAVTSGALGTSQTVYGPGVPSGTSIISLGSGTTGGLGTYTLNAAPAIVTGSQSTTTLTVSAVSAGALVPGQTLSLPGSPTVTTQLTGTAGGIGTYTVSNSQTLGSGTIVATITSTPAFHTSNNTLNVTSAADGTLAAGQSFYGRGVVTGAAIVSQTVGNTGGAGTYSVSTP